MENSLNNLTQGVHELAKHSTISFSIEGWPAAVLISIPTTVVIVYAIRAIA